MANRNDQHYDLHGQGTPLLNRMRNSTSVLGHAIEVTEVNLNLTITWHNEVENNHVQSMQVVTQLEEAYLLLETI